MRYADDPTFTIFLCGALGDIAEQARAKINAKVGREVVVGAFGPGAGWMDDPEQVQDVIDRVDASGATVLVYGLPAGDQERFLQDNRHRFANVRLFLPLGGTIDYEAGAVKRPPPGSPTWASNGRGVWFVSLGDDGGVISSTSPRFSCT